VGTGEVVGDEVESCRDWTSGMRVWAARRGGMEVVKGIERRCVLMKDGWGRMVRVARGRDGPAKGEGKARNDDVG